MFRAPSIGVRPAIVAFAAAILLVAITMPMMVGADQGIARPRTLVIRLDNLTPTQPLTPAVLFTHAAGADFVEAGQVMGVGFRYVAEDGNNEPLIAELQENSAVYYIVEMGNRQVHPLGYNEVDIEAPEGARLTLVSMLSCTNDGFITLDSWTVPDGEAADFGVHVMELSSLDAGSEENTERSIDIVDPCRGAGRSLEQAQDDGNNRVPTSEVIRPHPGLFGIGSYPKADYEWSDPVGRLTITARPGAAEKDPPPNVERAERTAWIAYLLGGSALGVMLATSVVLSRRR